MTKTELLNKLARDGTERLLLARALDKLELARDRGAPSHTGFLSPHERAAVEGLIHAAGYPRHLFYGGFPDAERTVCSFLPDWLEEDDWLTGSEYCPIRGIRCTWSGVKLSHRDFLGSILGLGLEREKIGDLLVGEGSCDILALDDVADFLLLHLTQAGHARLKVAPVSLAEVAPPAVQRKTIRDTVSSLRLDAVAASGFSMSRGKAADLISSGKVQLNHQECLKPDRAIRQGDVISCRGYGKCQVSEVGGPSKKGRIMIVLERYV